MNEKIRNALVANAHDSWTGWMVYLFQKSKRNPDGSVTIPKELVTRWLRQMKTAYNNLPEKEKESDLAEADKVMKILYMGLLELLKQD